MIRAAHPAGLPDVLLARIEAAVLNRARSMMTARRFLDFEGPLGAGIESLEVGPVHDTALGDTGAKVSSRRAIPVPTVYASSISRSAGSRARSTRASPSTRAPPRTPPRPWRSPRSTSSITASPR
jgi:hypothetical protein